MHQPQLTTHQASYFEYQTFPFVRPPELDGRDGHHPVVIIGAGPIGLILAILLARHGVKSVLIEAEAQVSSGSRALALARRTMEIIEQCGVADAILEGALLWKDGYSFYKGRVVHHLDIPFSDDDKFAPMTNLAQCIIEKILVERANALGVEIRFQTKLTALDAQDDGVALTLDTPEGPYRLRADWLLACDGARSTVRRLQGLRFEGRSYESRFVICDFNIAIDSPAGRRCYFDPPWLPGQSVLMHQAPHDVWRLDYQVPEHVSDEQALDRDRLRQNIQAHLAYIGVDAPWTFEWVTLYKPNALTLADYRHGRVLYCGDAAHLLPVFGVRGMNTGVQDSINLAWKLAAVVAGQASEALLDTYSSERVADARQICVEAGRSTQMMAPPSRGFKIMQQAVLSLALDQPWVRGLLHWRTSHPIDYADSPLTWPDAEAREFTQGPRPGAPPRNAQLIPGRTDGGFLLDMTGAAFTVLAFSCDQPQWQGLVSDAASLRARGIAVRLLRIRRAPDDGADAGATTKIETVIDDASGHLHRLWGAEHDQGGGTVYVLRPDQHVLARWKPAGKERLGAAIEHALAPHRRPVDPPAHARSHA
ncbi:MAG: FAD-dependent monooxygenase [Burkholderiaceae bacterium]